MLNFLFLTFIAELSFKIVHTYITNEKTTRKLMEIYLCNEQQRFNSLAADFDGSNAVQDPNDQLDIVEGQGQAVRGQLLVQVDGRQIWNKK